MIRYPHGVKQGRPLAPTLLPKDAASVRDAIKAATRYYGIRLQDIGTWATAAMRKSTPMSIETAERLFLAVYQPDASLVKEKPAKGMPRLEAEAAIKRNAEDPEANPLPEDPAIEFVLKMFEAAQVINNYARPLPGSTLFVIPGTSQRMAELLVESFVEELSGQVFSEELQRKLEDHLSTYFKVAERALREIEHSTLLESLKSLGVLSRVDLTNEFGKLVPEEQLYDPIPRAVTEAVTAAEERRNTKPNPQPAPPQKKPKKGLRRSTQTN